MAIIKHTVAGADTFPKLAIKYYKDVNLWRKLGQYNRDRGNTKDKTSPDYHWIYTGEVLEIPDKEFLKNYVTPKGATGQADQSDNTLMYAGLGVVALFFLFSGKKKRK